MTRLPASLQGSQEVFHGRRFDVRVVDQPGRDGRPHRKEVVVHPGAVVVLGLLSDGPEGTPPKVILIRNRRLAVDQVLWELPAGTLEPPEPPQLCAGRELVEETGYHAERLRKLVEFYSSPGICTEKMHVFVADQLRAGTQQLEEGEDIVVAPTPLAEALEMVRKNEIRDGKTIAALLYYHAFGGEPR